MSATNINTIRPLTLKSPMPKTPKARTLSGPPVKPPKPPKAVPVLKKPAAPKKPQGAEVSGERLARMLQLEFAADAAWDSLSPPERELYRNVVATSTAESHPYTVKPYKAPHQDGVPKNPKPPAQPRVAPIKPLKPTPIKAPKPLPTK